MLGKNIDVPAGAIEIAAQSYEDTAADLQLVLEDLNSLERDLLNLKATGHVTDQKAQNDYVALQTEIDQLTSITSAFLNMQKLDKSELGVFLNRAYAFLLRCEKILNVNSLKGDEEFSLIQKERQRIEELIAKYGFSIPG